MKLWDKIFKRKKVAQEEYTEDNWNEASTLRREDVNMNDEAQREKYVRSCLEQIEEASKEMDE